MPVFCNPLNGTYRYQFIRNPQTGAMSVNREAANPSLILYRGRYYLFASMTLGVWVSDDLAHWENHRLPDSLPLYDYAPDARVVGGAVVLCASRRDGVCDYYRTQDPLNGPYERIPGTFAFWDPNLFEDDDGRVYFYWGCSSETPIWGAELDPKTLRPLGEPKALIAGDPFTRGYERTGENYSLSPRTDAEVDALVREFLAARGMDEASVPADVMPMLRGMFSQRPFVEGAWMTKHGGTYYLQYACPGTEYNTYADGVYVSDRPLGPFVPAENNPYSCSPGGFMPGAGHGSTLEDRDGRFWHAATMRISVHHNFERRIGLWPAGFDKDGRLFCNQRYGDWPMRTDSADPWEKPEWYLLSYGKDVTASGFAPGHEPGKAADENAQTWWQADGTGDAWLQLDLGRVMDVRAVQINFADGELDVPAPGPLRGGDRFIDEQTMYTRWILEGSADGAHYEILADKTRAETDLAHDFMVFESGVQLRFLRLSRMKLPYGQRPCVSGLRVFGLGGGQPPCEAVFTAKRSGELDFEVEMQAEGATGYNVLWGTSEDTLYHSCLTFANTARIGALVQGQRCVVRVDAFNENGITEGRRIAVLEPPPAEKKDS